VSISIGITTHQQTHTETGKQLLEWADSALYRAKADGRNRIEQWKDPAGSDEPLNSARL
jgi:diguanylate cyclase (GGDEF)-like protein